MVFTHQRSLKTATIFIIFISSEFFKIEEKYITGIKFLCYVKIILGNHFELLRNYLKIVLQTT